MADKKKSLPFVVAPRLKPILEDIGTEESGIIQVERKGYLTVAEKSLVQGAMADETAMSEVFLVARSIAAEEGITAQEVFADLGSEEPKEYYSRHAGRLAEAMNKLQRYDEKVKLVAATALLMTRVDASWDPSDTSSLHPDMLAALYELYQDEDRKSTAALEAAAATQDKAQEGSEGKA